jgi:predicted nuclease of restriction endonuclease-like (RecB) superfamily
VKISKPLPIYNRIRNIIESARTGAMRSVNTAQVVSNWMIGREIVEEEQKGKARAEYGKRLIENLSKRLLKEFGRGFAVRNLETFRVFYLEYPELVIPHALRAELTGDASQRILHTPRGKSEAVRRKSSIGNELSKLPQIPYAVRAESWRPGLLHSNFCWTHYRALLLVDKENIRAFYEIETVKNNWVARELERQINSLLYERLALSRDKKGLMQLATKGQTVQTPADVFKDPVVMEFLGLPESSKLVETGLEQAMIDNLQDFLLEMGKGFAFVGRQKRLTLDGDHFYPDLVFYHIMLKCYVIIDLKVKKLTHGDLGQMQMYVNYYDREVAGPKDSSTIGLILCADKNDAVVKYVLDKKNKSIFASRYKLHLPSEAELRTELRREVRELGGPRKEGAK